MYVGMELAEATGTMFRYVLFEEYEKETGRPDRPLDAELIVQATGDGGWEYTIWTECSTLAPKELAFGRFTASGNPLENRGQAMDAGSWLARKMLGDTTLRQPLA